jgi:mycoredoxin
MTLELFGTSSCPYTAELREELEWQGRDFVEYDVERNAEALRRMLALSEGAAAVPVLVEGGRVVAVGFRGRSCYVTRAATESAGG